MTSECRKPKSRGPPYHTQKYPHPQGSTLAGSSKSACARLKTYFPDENPANLAYSAPFWSAWQCRGSIEGTCERPNICYSGGYLRYQAQVWRQRPSSDTPLWNSQYIHVIT